MKDKLLKYLDKVAAEGERPDGTWGDKHTKRRWEGYLINGLNKCIKHRDFKHDQSLNQGKIWSPFMTINLPARAESHMGVNLSEDCTHIGIYFFFDWGGKQWEADGMPKRSGILIQMRAIAMYRSTGEFVGFTADSITTPALDTFCRNVFGKGSV